MKKYNLFELKPCHECPHTCVEGVTDRKCPYDKMVEDELKIGVVVKSNKQINLWIKNILRLKRSL